MPKHPSVETEVQPNPQLEKRTRRSFTTEYKLKIIAQADACKHGELGELLRREKLYSNQLATWRRELKAGGEQDLSKTQPGPSPAKSPEQKRIEQLEKELAKLRQSLVVKDGCIELQKKALSMLDALENEKNS